jgi:hypothetical protein
MLLPAGWDHRIEEHAQLRRPFGVFRPAHGMAQFAIDFEVAREMPGDEISYHCGCDLRIRNSVKTVLAPPVS